MSRKRNLKNLSRSTNLTEESGIRSIKEISRELTCSDCRVKVPILKITSRGTNRTLTCNCPQCQKEISKTFVDRGLTTFENVLNKVNNYLNAAESMLYNIIQMYHEVLTFLEDCEVPPPEDIIDNGAFFLPLIIPAIVQTMAPVFSSPQSSCGVYAKNATTAEYYIKNVFRDLEKIPPVVTQIRDLIAMSALVAKVLVKNIRPNLKNYFN